MFVRCKKGDLKSAEDKGRGRNGREIEENRKMRSGNQKGGKELLLASLPESEKW